MMNSANFDFFGGYLDRDIKAEFREIERQYRAKYVKDEHRYSHVPKFYFVTTTDIDLGERELVRSSLSFAPLLAASCENSQRLASGVALLVDGLNSGEVKVEPGRSASSDLYWLGLKMGRSARAWQPLVLESPSIENSSDVKTTIVLRCCWLHVEFIDFDYIKRKWTSRANVLVGAP